jgi:L-aminopeptidase/D-esterase-like protein
VLPEGVLVGHWSDTEAWTGCTVVLLPAGSVAACEVRGGGPGTIGSDLLTPAGSAPGADAILLTGGSAFGLAAATGVVGWLEERGLGYETPAGPVPLVAGAVCYDLGLGDGSVRPTEASGYAACDAAGTAPARGSAGVGTGCTVGKLLRAPGWTKGGFGHASATLPGGGMLAVLAAVNAWGEVVAEDGSVLAGVWRDGAYVRTSELLREGTTPAGPRREGTTLVCLVTDATLTKTQAWLVARSATSGLARAVVPSATAVDGDTTFCAATGRVEEDPLTVAVLAADVAAAAIRDGVRQATGAPGCPAASER